MIKIHSDQSGFNGAEGLLILVIIAVVGFTGWYVWHARQQANKTYTATNQAAQSTVPKVTKKAAAPAPTQKYLTIKEWGVEIPLSTGITDAYYVYKESSDTNQTVIYLGTKSLTAMDSQCAPDKIGVASIFRQTIAAHDANVLKDDPAVYNVGDTKVGDYYYGFGQAQAACSDTIYTDASKQQEADITLFRTAFKSIKAY